VVFLSRGDSFGSGFFVAPRQILTNAHVVGKKDRVLVVLHDGRKVEGRVLELGKNDLDLALVEVPVTWIRPLPLSSASLRIGGWVASVSHGYGGIWTFTTGMVSNIYPIDGERPVFQTQIPLNPGSSGGPVFDREGRVVGVVTAGIEEAQGINFAIRSDVAFEALSLLAAVDPERLTVHAPAGANVLVDGKLAGKGPRVLVRVGPGTHRVQAVVGGAMKERRVVWPEERTVTLE
jgi:serine protease Do